MGTKDDDKLVNSAAPGDSATLADSQAISDGEHIHDDGAFPATVNVPGQLESRRAYARLTEIPYPAAEWWDDYKMLRLEGWTWRKATLIAWMSMPASRRWPKTLEELATSVLGLRSPRTVRKWREKDPRIDERANALLTEMLHKHRADVFEALIKMAKKDEANAHPDRRLFLEITGDYKPRGAVALSGPDGGPIEQRHVIDLSEYDDEQISQLVRNLQAAQPTQGD